MAKIKQMRGRVTKKDGPDVYQFINGVAIVSGVRFQGNPMKVNLKEFNKLRREDVQYGTLRCSASRNTGKGSCDRIGRKA